MLLLYSLTAFAVLVSFISSKDKTLKSFKITAKKILKILPALLLMTILTSLALSFVPDNAIVKYLGNENKTIGFLLALGSGSIAIMPGFIAFPLASILLEKGVTYFAISAFTTTLMMVGIITYPVEKEYFGSKITIVRNFISLIIAIIVSLVIGFCYGEFN